MQAINTTNPIHRISVEHFHRMIEADCFGDADRVELIDGEMRDMAPIGPPHGGRTDTLTMIFAAALAGKAIVRVQGALVLDDGTEVYPDLQVLKERADRYRTKNPTGADVLLVIELADSSLAFDLRTKLAHYARAGVPRYWVVDIRHRCIHDHRDPDRFGGRYRQLHSVSDGHLAVELAGVSVAVPLTELFPL